MLNRLIKKKKLLILGINSGTSIDSLDLALAEISRSSAYTVKFVNGADIPFPKTLKESLKTAADNRNVSLEEIMHLDNKLGCFIGKQAKKFVDSFYKSNKRKIDLIASHGQTIRHLPDKKKSATCQIGSPACIAQETKLPVIADFRQADIALGNEGAPITTGAVAKLFSDSKQSHLILNVGGMANYFYLPAKSVKSEIIALDIGPGNILSDLLAQTLFGKKSDRNGDIASKGTISKRLLTLLSADSFFESKQESTGRERFGKSTIEKILSFQKQFELSAEDLFTTVIELTCSEISKQLIKLTKKDKKIKKLYLTGGGRKNIFLVKQLQIKLPELQICSIDELGIPADYLEAVSYGVLAEHTLRAKPIHKAKDKNGNTPLLGMIHLPPQKK